MPKREQDVETIHSRSVEDSFVAVVDSNDAPRVGPLLWPEVTDAKGSVGS